MNKCEACKEPFTPARNSRGRFCSKLCYNKSVAIKPKVCGNPVCDEEFISRDPASKYCSRSCAAVVNNISKPKRSVEGKCKDCGDPISSSRTYCPSCWKDIKLARSLDKKIKGSGETVYFCKDECGTEVARRYRKCDECREKSLSKSWEVRRQEKIKTWKSGDWDGGVGSDRVISVAVRNYILEKYDGRCQCKDCPVPGGFRGTHPVTGNFVIEVEHIDGNSRNHKEENLTLLCPICHSMTPTYRALNKNSGRSSRRAKARLDTNDLI